MACVVFLKLQNIKWSMENQRITAMIAIALSGAFDTVDHNILFDVLNKQFGLSSQALKWYDSYLRPRSLRVNVNLSYSSTNALDFSVPQDSCVGSSFQLVYANTMQDIVPATIDIHRYPDNHALKKSFTGSAQTDEIDTIRTLQNLTIIIKEWMDQNNCR